MNLFRSVRTAEKKGLVKAEIIAENSNGSDYPYSDDFSEFDEGHSKRAIEMENILGNALAMTERNNGSIHSLHRSGTNSAIEIGRRIGSLHSREDLAASEAHLSNNDSFSYISRSSSLGSAVSLPTFVKADNGDPMIFSQQSLENMMFDRNDGTHDEETSCQNMGYDNTSHRKTSKSTNATKIEGLMPNRSWSKLRREVNEEARATTKTEKKDNHSFRRPQSIGRISLSFPKKILQDSRNRLSSVDIQEKRSSSHSYEKDNKARKGYAKDYDVEVSLQTQKKSWDRHLSMMRGGKGKKTSSNGTSKSRSRDSDNNKGIGYFRKSKTNNTVAKVGQEVDDSFDTTRTNTEHSWQAPVDSITVERKSDVVLKMHETHKGDMLFQALEVACCHSIDGETLDLITEMVPPQV